jgi:hypothetical protein
MRRSLGRTARGMIIDGVWAATDVGRSDAGILFDSTAGAPRDTMDCASACAADNVQCVGMSLRTAISTAMWVVSTGLVAIRNQDFH